MPAIKTKTRYLCQSCGSMQMKWAGRCPDCGEWNTLVETVVDDSPRRGTSATRQGLAPNTNEPLPLPAIPMEGAARLPVPMVELSRVLGGGIVPGSAVLISGDPGIGKSTLLLQMASLVARTAGKVLYVSGEESAHQIKMRAARLGIEDDTLYVMADIHVESIVNTLEQMQPALCIVDSIQSVYTEALQSAAGSVSQIRECAAYLLRTAKGNNIPLFLVGHVTKEGAIAGPRVLEHMVDTVLYLEGERFNAYRLLRSVKNRFGSTNEVGVFEMAEAGMIEVLNPSAAFLAERLPNAAGSAIAVTLEGTRPLLVEVQALVSSSPFAMPRRTANGVDVNRLLLLAAVLSKRAGLKLADQDIFANVIGGLRINEPAADLAIAVAIASSYRNLPVHADLAMVGEVGLSGELRQVSQVPKRLNEAAKLGFKRVLMPRSVGKKLEGKPEGLEVIGVRSVYDALDMALVAAK